MWKSVPHNDTYVAVKQDALLNSGATSLSDSWNGFGNVNVRRPRPHWIGLHSKWLSDPNLSYGSAINLWEAMLYSLPSNSQGCTSHSVEESPCASVVFLTSMPLHFTDPNYPQLQACNMHIAYYSAQYRGMGPKLNCGRYSSSLSTYQWSTAYLRKHSNSTTPAVAASTAVGANYLKNYPLIHRDR